MAGEGKEVPGTDDNEYDVAAEHAGFAASFGEAPDETPSDDPEDTAAEDTQAETGDDAPEEEGAAPEELTPEDQAAQDAQKLKELLDSVADLPQKHEMTAQQIRQLHGKFGEINKLVHDLQNANVAEPVKTKFDKTSFAKLSTDFPEVAEALAEDLSNIALIREKAAAPAVDIDKVVEERVAMRVAQIEEATEIKLLTMAHRDWRTVKDSADFKAWVAKLPPEEQNELNNSRDALYVSDKLTEYKAQKAQVDTEKDKRHKRLAGAILPKTTPAKVSGLVTEQDGFNAAFKT